MEIKFLLPLFLLLAQPAFAQSVSNCDQNLKSAGYPIDGISGSSSTDPNLKVWCSQCTTQQANSALTLAQQSATWTTLTNPPPNPLGFITDVQIDPTLQPVFYLLSPYQFTLSNYSAATAPAIKAIWAQLVAQYGQAGGPLSTDQQTAIELHATNNNMPLR